MSRRRSLAVVLLSFVPVRLKFLSRRLQTFETCTQFRRASEGSANANDEQTHAEPSTGPPVASRVN
jgi:hypothetical protein